MSQLSLNFWKTHRPVEESTTSAEEPVEKPVASGQGQPAERPEPEKPVAAAPAVVVRPDARRLSAADYAARLASLGLSVPAEVRRGSCPEPNDPQAKLEAVRGRIANRQAARAREAALAQRAEALAPGAVEGREAGPVEVAARLRELGVRDEIALAGLRAAEVKRAPSAEERAEDAGAAQRAHVEEQARELLRRSRAGERVDAREVSPEVADAYARLRFVPPGAW